MYGDGYAMRGSRYLCGEQAIARSVATVRWRDNDRCDGERAIRLVWRRRDQCAIMMITDMAGWRDGMNAGAWAQAR